MRLTYQRDHTKELADDIEDIRSNVPTRLVYVGHDDNRIHFIDSEVEDYQYDLFMKQGALE